ncbi:hypothetical protein D3C74_419470 [compost metagenome]
MQLRWSVRRDSVYDSFLRDPISEFFRFRHYSTLRGCSSGRGTMQRQVRRCWLRRSDVLIRTQIGWGMCCN